MGNVGFVIVTTAASDEVFDVAWINVHVAVACAENRGEESVHRIQATSGGTASTRR